ncbi:IS21 family transposase [Streptomyces roseochromogenus]|uniref:Integrase n=1 Tax=Streptomyces roseochromogenus subsp. oscitans DS 12.976 TaxID=1352936 RepID=V6KAR4_STRRC|nr:IS21 family transposase [Streptomyces roseochromogenus]EST17936.1 integrase [Streptomyces roseochromogenus subsp. oscitans DS 12.976]EST18305.1 integrase [Streptomyces roseochromogenus subsp. oscitans DS 12.976]EST18678.1 integrase [Streptomyces roseochromogenus subsp. oscitans DS 12.976]EST24472.1 integrase [Streptomyces roseochromogenus subsp. oscitans DS 12.976]EST27197.1 integrase [Streptomyces roseochromogenus subsp. oscitans DS 12.976]
MTDIVEIYVHWYAGRSKTQLAASLGLDRKTIRKYLAPAEAAGITPGGPPMSEPDWAKLIKSWFPEQANRRLNQLTWPEIEKHRDYVVELLNTCTVTTIHQRLRDERKLQAGLTSFRRWVHENLPDEAARAKVTVLRENVEPGSEAQIDYGFLGQWINANTGRRHRIWAFVMVLPASRHMFVRPVAHMDQHAWTQAHVEAFRYFGGVPRRLVPDNLKTGVDKPDLYDPKINKSYAELASYYGALVDPARALKPKDKPRVERPMPYVRDSYWRGRTFTSLEHMQAEALLWSRNVAGQRQCRPLGGAAPLAVFESIEAPVLLPLPEAPFVLARWSKATVGPDIHIKVGRTLYSVPWKLIGRRVDVRSTATMVQVFHEGELVKTHAALEQGKRTDKTDYPPEKIAFQMRTPIWCRGQASQVGDACREVIDQLLEVNALYRLRAAQGVLGLRKKYGDIRLEAACRKAITVGDPSYRTVKGILVAGTETDPEPETGDGGASAFLHGPEGLFATDIPLQIPDDVRDDQGNDDVEEVAR